MRVAEVRRGVGGKPRVSCVQKLGSNVPVAGCTRRRPFRADCIGLLPTCAPPLKSRLAKRHGCEPAGDTTSGARRAAPSGVRVLAVRPKR